MLCKQTAPALWGLLICLTTLAGCGFGPPQADYSGLGLVEISGTVTLDGKPLENAAIFFHDKPNRRYSWGMTDSQGRYSLMFDSRKSGVMPGMKEIEITTTKNPGASPVASDNEDSAVEPGSFSEGQDDVPDPSQSKKERVPAKYNSRSELTFEVTESRDDVNFDLTSN